MSIIKEIIKQCFCKHLDKPLEFVRNIHGDMVYSACGNRSVWKCPDCGKNIYRSEAFNIGEVSDGYHTFNELYHHRAVLFSVICNEHKDIAWKSKHHNDGSMYDGMFIVGIETPDGQATYHYDIKSYWDMFKIKELEYAPEYDGYTPTQAIERIGKLNLSNPQVICQLSREMLNEACNELLKRAEVVGQKKPKRCKFPL